MVLLLAMKNHLTHHYVNNNSEKPPLYSSFLEAHENRKNIVQNQETISGIGGAPGKSPDLSHEPTQRYK